MSGSRRDEKLAVQAPVPGDVRTPAPLTFERTVSHSHHTSRDLLPSCQPDRFLTAALRCLDDVRPLSSTDADLVALAAWARLHLATKDSRQRDLARAELEHLLGLAVRRDEQRLGWGLGWAWDAFADGTVNPPDTVYAYQTALAGIVLCDAHLVLGEQLFATEAQRAATMLMTCLWGWHDAESRFRSVWYSDQEADQLQHLQKHDVNALSAGLLSRLPALRAEYAERLDAMVGHLVASQGVGLSAEPGSRASWRAGSTGSRLGQPNDLVHHVLILIGLANTGDSRAAKAVGAATTGLATQHFRSDGVPHEGRHTRGTRGWGPPAALFILAEKKHRSFLVRRIAKQLRLSIDASGTCAYVDTDEPRARVWYALALARWACSRLSHV